MAENTQVPVRESVGAAMQFLRAHGRFVLMVAGAAAAASALLDAASLALPAIGLISALLGWVVQATAYAALTSVALGQGIARLAQAGLRVLGALFVIGFFLFIVFFLLSIPLSVLLFAGPLAPYVAGLQAANGDTSAAMAVVTRIAEEQAGLILATFMFCTAVWLALTSRLYLAAPASVEQGRILTFETWSWTKGAMLRIMVARLMLLAPAYILVTAIGFLVGRLIGVNLFDVSSIAAAAQANPVGLIAFSAVQAFVSLALYSALEAGLSTYLYRGLRPAPPLETGA